jgi:hypothetical protein
MEVKASFPVPEEDIGVNGNSLDMIFGPMFAKSRFDEPIVKKFVHFCHQNFNMELPQLNVSNPVFRVPMYGQIKNFRLELF